MSIIKAAGLTALPIFGASISDRIFSCRVNQIDEWYNSKLIKPRICPPNWVFPFAWSGLYPSMGYASYLILRDGVGESRNIALGLYASQLVLNWAWSPIFFGNHKLGLSSVAISLMTANVAVCALKFNEINNTAAYLMLPYLAWISFATFLSFGFWLNNRNKNYD